MSWQVPEMMKSRFFLVTLVVCAAIHCAGCDWVYRALQKEGAEEKEILGAITPLEHNPNVEKVQTLLKVYGYNVGRSDGVLGVNTRNAIGAFQEDNQIPPSRFVDKATWAKLMALDNAGLVKKGKLDMAAVQRALQQAGFDPGPVDGREGHKTQAAIKAFQKARGLKPDGKIGIKTLRELAQYAGE